MKLTVEQHEIVQAIAKALEADPEIEAAWIGGSLGSGGGDAYSDVDTVALVVNGPPSAVGRRHAENVSRIAPAALVNLLFEGRILNVVTMDWRRFDISFVEGADLVRYESAKLTPLFNRGGRTPSAAPAESYSPAPATLNRIVNEFLRVIGLLVVAVGREEWLMGQAGMDILRRLTIDLMLEENRIGPSERGGALHLNRLLTAQQRSELEALPAVAANYSSVRAGNIAVAGLFLPRAWVLSREIGMPWPDDFERVTRRHLQDRLGVELPTTRPA